MVKGTTKQVLVVSGANSSLFEQAIFLVRDDALRSGGVSEDDLLQEAKAVCRQPHDTICLRSRLLWLGLGSGITGLVWLISCLM